MPTTSTHTLYQFDELSDDAKKKARDWFRQAPQDDEWWYGVYEDAAQIAEILGIDLRQKPVKLMSGATRYDPCIWFRGFSSQGDGASFEGTYTYAKGMLKNLKAYCNDAELFRIAGALQDAQRRAFYGISASIGHRGNYTHSHSMDIDVHSERPCDEEAIREALRDFADWIYWTLEKEWDYQNSDETVDENIRANEYTFDEEGNRDD